MASWIARICGVCVCVCVRAQSWKMKYYIFGHTDKSKGAFTPDANEANNILSLLASFAHEIRFIRAWNSLHNRREFASWEGLLPGSSSLVAKCMPGFVKVRSSIVQLRLPTYNHD